MDVCVCDYILAEEAGYESFWFAFAVIVLVPSFYVFKLMFLKTQSSKASSTQEGSYFVHSGFIVSEISSWIRSREPANSVPPTTTFLPKCNTLVPNKKTLHEKNYHQKIYLFQGFISRWFVIFFFQFSFFAFSEVTE